MRLVPRGWLSLLLLVTGLGPAAAAEAPTAPTVRLQGPLVAVTWAPIPAAAAYRLYRQVGAGPWELLTRPQLAGTRYLDSALVPGQRHGYRVTAVTAAGEESAPSPEAALDVPSRTAPGRSGY